MRNIPFKFHKAFFYDPFFSDCWDTDGELGSTTRKPPTHFQMILDVQLFRPPEVTVRLSDDNSKILINGKHEERSEPCHGYVARQFTRSFVLPHHVRGEKLECHLSSDGVLQIMAPIDWKMANLNKNSTSTSSDHEEYVHNWCSAKFCEVCHNEWSKMRRSDEYFRVLPTYELIPYWERRFICFNEQSRRNFGIHSDHANYKVLLDVAQFMEPGELKVTCTDHVISIEGNHDTKDDLHGSISRKFTCIYDLPKSVDAKDLYSTLSADGILEIVATKSKSMLFNRARVNRVISIECDS